MQNLRKSKSFKLLSIVTAFVHLMQIFYPSTARALTSGPSSPEFSSFEPVATTDMVNIFGGDFTYNLPVINIPGPEGSGYALSLSYNSGASPEEEASWVGYGWSLNPGAINRQVRGIPDDYRGEKITKYNKVRANWSQTLARNNGIEAFSVDVAFNESIRFNNNTGLSKSWGFNLGYKGMASLGFTRQDGETTLNYNVNPSAFMSKKKDKTENGKDEEKEKPVADEKKGLKNMVKNESKRIKDAPNVSMKKQNYKNLGKQAAMGIAGQFTSSYGLYSFSTFSQPMNITKYDGLGINRSASLQGNIPIFNIGLESGTSGNFNIQLNEEEMDMNSFGFMFNPNSSIHSNLEELILSDYTVEKASNFDNRDYFLGIPYSQPDNFNVSGESIGGSFRIFQTGIGTYYPNKVESKQLIYSSGTEFGIGLHISVGFDFGVGEQVSNVGKWNTSGSEFVLDPFISETTYPVMRFANDMGGKIEYSNTTANGAGEISTDLAIPGLKDFDVDESNLGLLPSIDREEDMKSSSFVSYNLYDGNGGTLFPVMEKRSSISHLHDQTTPPFKIFELSTVNEAGMTYLYGLPVYVSSERNLNIGVEDANPSDIENNYLVYGDVYVKNPLLNEIVVGDKRDNKYTSTHLLTTIATPDYVDVGNNGTGDEDFGGWTAFDYRMAHSDYAFRTPYAGMLYQKGSLSDKKDDMGSINYGEKEVYYMKAIETKTHIACFVTNNSDYLNDYASYFSNLGQEETQYLTGILTGSNELRNDGLGAQAIATGFDAHAKKPTTTTSKNTDADLDKLEKIVLFAKDRPGTPLKIVHFEYDNSLVRNLPNSLNGKYPLNQTDPTKYSESGKLTLKKVWFEYEGIVNAKVSPYQFKYEYKALNQFAPEIGSTYSDLFTDINSISANANQNPDYFPQALDGWGNYQVSGNDRFNKMMPWVNQEESPSNFDPAAWQLKQIVLPSGGEIHVHYEQKDYAYVQDRQTLAMVSLDETGSNVSSVQSSDNYDTDNRFYIKHNNIEVDDVGEYAKQLRIFFGLSDKDDNPISIPEDRRKKIYFKYLYSLIGGAPAINNCKSDYISGYTVVRNVGESGGRIYLELGSDQTMFTSGQRRNVPREMCYDFAVTQRGGKLNNTNCTGEIEDKYDDILASRVADVNGYRDLGKIKNDPLDVYYFKRDVVNDAMEDLESDLSFKTPGRGDVCKTLNYELSYLRLPTFHAKKGGGIRVKRLLMYDSGLENGQAMLYGSEYEYVREDGKSSGVAANEPMAIREENALVNFLPKKSKSFVARLISGRDKEQTEGPIGENLLPGPSIGHSRVVVKNIHDGFSGTGYQVNEFFTAQDYPFDKHYTYETGQYDFSGAGVSNTVLTDNKKRDWMKIPAGMFSYSLDKRWYSQGYRFILTDMHGKQKRISSYGGRYASGEAILTAQTAYEYFEPGEKVRLIKYNIATKQFEYTWDTPGKEEDITIESKSVTDDTFDIGLELDVGIGLSWVPPICISFGLSFAMMNNQMNTHVVSKVLRYPSIVKSKTTYQDGVEHLERYLAFDINNASPVLTMSKDSYDELYMTPSSPNDGKYYSFNIPAAWIYENMGQKAGKMTPEDYTNQLAEIAGSVTTYGLPGSWVETTNYSGLTTGNIGTDNVVSAFAKTYANEWFYNTNSTGMNVIEEEYAVPSSALDDLNKKWRIWNEYVYKTSVTSSNEISKQIVDGGIFNDFIMFDYDKVSHQRHGTVDAQDQLGDGIWVRTKSINKYTPDGSPVEESALPDELNIVSSVRMGYGKLLPIAVGNNSTYENLFFEDFENHSKSNENSYHSGSKSLNWTLNSSHEFVSQTDGIKLTQSIYDHGARVFMWLKHDSLNSSHALNGNIKIVVNNNVFVDLKRVSRSGEWQLYSALIDDWTGLSIGNSIQVRLAYNINVGGGESLFVDDFRFQPNKAGVTCYVYDPASFRLLTQFDDSHFGTYYQYNDEGKLMRTMKETERGMKTIQENQYNVPKIAL